MISSFSTTNTSQRTALYMRVSTKEQRIDGYGLEAQKAALENYVQTSRKGEYISRKEWVFCDTHTGSDIMRPALQSLLELVKKKQIDTVIVWKIDRLSRSMKHLLGIFELFKEHHINFVSVQENMNFNGAIGNFIFNILSSVAELERSMIKTRTRSGIIASAEMGNFTGTTVPYGYEAIKTKGERGKLLKILPHEQKIVQQIFNWYVYDEMGFGTIADRLNDEKVPLGSYAKTRTLKNKWTHRHVEKIIKRSIYRGEFVANKKDENGTLLLADQWTIVSIPPCIDELLFAMANRKRTERKGKHRTTGHVYLLSGKLYDISTHKRPKFVGFPRSKGGYSYRRNSFTDNSGEYHTVFEFPAAVAEESVWEKLKTALKEPDIFVADYLRKHNFSAERTKKVHSELLRLREQKANMYLEIGRIEQAYEKGLYDIEKAEQKTAAVENRVEQIDGRTELLQQELHKVSINQQEIASLRKIAKSVNYNIDALPRRQQKLLIDLLVDRIEMDRKELPSKSDKQKKWHRSMTVYFRFCTATPSAELTDLRTQKPQHKAKKSVSKNNNNRNGGRGGGRWSSAKITFTFEKVILNSNIQGRTWRIGLKELPDKID